MPRGRGTRLVAKRLLDATAEDNDLDYLGQFIKRTRSNNDSNGQVPRSKVPEQQLDDRTTRRARREAIKLSQAQGVRVEMVSPRRGNIQWSEENANEDESGDAAEEEEDYDEDDDGGLDRVDHARITQAMNQARNRVTKPTINGIGSRQRNNQIQHAEAASDDGEDSQGELLSQSPEGDEVRAPRDADDRSRSRHGANSKGPQQKKLRKQNARDKADQKDKTNASAPDEDESEAESSTEIDDQFAEDTAFVEAPQQGEETVTVKVVINSMGGILKTLQHPAWTGSTQWAREFQSDNNDYGQKTCKTRSGKVLMDEMQGLNNILEEATESPEDESEDDYDFTSAAILYLRTKSVEAQQHLTHIDKIVDEICSRKLLPVPRAGSSNVIAQVVKRRKALLRDLSQRLIPMLMITVKKACGICPSEDNRSRTTLYLDCFRLQFFLRPLAWADRLHKALERGLEQGTRDDESQTDADDPDESGSEAQDSKKKARSAFGSQLDALYSAGRKAEREIQDSATQAERQEREDEIKRQNRERNEERQREIAAKIQREKDEQIRRDEKALEAFFNATHALRSKADPLKELWDQSQAALPEQFRATSTFRAAPGGSSAGHGQGTAGAARSQGDPSRNARVESVSDSDDPFSDNYVPRSKTPVSNRHSAGNGLQQNRRSQQRRNASREWSDEEDKAMIMAIRYKRDYDVVSMAQKLRRSEDDVARKAAFLKQGYREVYTQKGLEVPAWAL